MKVQTVLPVLFRHSTFAPEKFNGFLKRCRHPENSAMIHGQKILKRIQTSAVLITGQERQSIEHGELYMYRRALLHLISMAPIVLAIIYLQTRYSHSMQRPVNV